jgi:hypothetical protein
MSVWYRTTEVQLSPLSALGGGPWPCVQRLLRRSAWGQVLLSIGEALGFWYYGGGGMIGGNNYEEDGGFGLYACRVRLI